MNEQDWLDELATYATPKQTAEEILEGVADHLDTECTSGNTQTVATRGTQPRAPFSELPLVCDRGTQGCNLVHNDHAALHFARIGLEHLVKQFG
jgi:hypothetical protein